MDRSDLIRRAKTAYAAGARQTGRVLTRIGVLGDEAPARDQRIRHWAHSLTKVHDSLAIAELDVPWWTYRAIDVVEAWLGAHPRPIRVFEYGSGASTLWLAARTDEVHSVEHHAGFAEHIRPASSSIRTSTSRSSSRLPRRPRPCRPRKRGMPGSTSPTTSP